MALHHIFLLLIYAAGMSVGQVLFKAAAVRIAGSAFTPMLVISNPQLIGALALYFTLTGLWVYVLTAVPLSRAYPFAVLSFISTPLLANLLFGETLRGPYFIGTGLIIAGLFVITRT